MKFGKFLILLFTMAFLASCSKDSFLDSPHTEVVPEDAVAFSVNFPGRSILPATSGAVRSISDGTYPAHVKEKTLSDVKIYVFDSNSSSGVDKPGNLVSVEQVAELQSGNNAEMPSNTAVGKFYLRKLFGKTAFFVAVANVDFSEEKIYELIGKSFQEVANTLVTQIPGIDNYFPMVSAPEKVNIPIKGTAGTAKTFMLERLSVRIDIINETVSNQQTGAVKFDLRSAYIPTGALNQSYLINTLADKLYVGDDKGTAHLHPSHPIVLKRTSPSTVAGNEEFFEQIYTYENGNKDFELQVEGFIDGKTFAFSIPFKKKLIRNTRYLVRLRNAENKSVKYSIEVLKWNEEENTLMEEEVLKTKPQIVSHSMANATGSAQTGSPLHKFTEKGTHSEIQLLNAEAYNLRLVVKSNVAIKFDGPKGMITPWVSYEEKTPEPSEQIEGAQVKVYHLKFAKNEDAEKRTAKLVFYSYGNEDQPGMRKEILIEQEKTAYRDIINPLAFLSNRFVDVFNTEAKPITRENMGERAVHGKWYQWGRNVDLDIHTPITVVRRSIAPTSAEVKTPKTFYSAFLDNVWSSEGFVVGDTWESIVGKAPGSPDYVGNNAKDPSYPDFKMPTWEQMVTIFPSHAQNKVYSESDIVPSTNFPSPIAIQGKVGDATTKPYKFHIKHAKGSLIFYAITLDETGISTDPEANKYRTAIRYEFIPYKGMVITARHLGKETVLTSIDQVAVETWWNTTTKAKEGSDVVRILPFRGHRGSDYTQVDLACNLWGNGCRNHYSVGQYHPIAFICEGGSTNGHFMGLRPIYSGNTFGILPFRLNK